MSSFNSGISGKNDGKDVDYTFYLVTDTGMCPREKLADVVERSILGGASVVQLREKNISTRDFLEEAKMLSHVTQKYDVPLIINDRLDIALAVDCGLHVGQDDMPVETARKLLGPDRLIGVSAGTLKEALDAEDGGADYLGVGAVFPTGTKTDAVIVSEEDLREIGKRVRIPFVVIGRINRETIPELIGRGLENISGVAVVSAVMLSPDPEKETAEIRELFTDCRRKAGSGMI